MKTGYLAFLDVLGFSALVARDEKGIKLAEYQEKLANALTGKSALLKPARYIVFSDSVVITVEGDDFGAFHSIVVRCAGLFGDLLLSDIAVRGAIAFGSYVEDERTNSAFIAGRALVDAYRYETSQNWVGIMIAPSAIEKNSDLADRCQLVSPPPSGTDRHADLQFACSVRAWGGIPFHDGGFEGFAITPNGRSYTGSAMIDFLNRAGQKLSWLKALAPDPAAQLKYQNSLTFLTHARTWWSGRGDLHEG